MKREELMFCDNYEKQANALLLMEVVKENLTEQGLESYNKLKEWVHRNTNRYLELTGR
jgi:hypothetical protein